MHDYGINNDCAKELRNHLSDQGFIEEQLDLARVLKATLKYARRFFAPKIEASIIVDPQTGLHTYTGKIIPGEPDKEQIEHGFISIDRLASIGERALAAADFQIWVLLDRLVAFAENQELEKNALRALFRVS
jgi:hypothetical protein